MTQHGPCPIFKEIGQRLGPFNLAMIPIWRGGSLSFVAMLGLRLVTTDLPFSGHASPADAVEIHKEVRSRHSLAMHFATFAGSAHEAIEPLVELSLAREEAKVGDWIEDGGFGWVNIGDTAIIPVREDASGAVVQDGVEESEDLHDETKA